MNSSQFASFIERIKTDDALRRKVAYAEESAARDTLRLKQDLDQVSAANLEAINKIAEEAGYDLQMDIRRPEKAQITPTEQEVDNLRCILTCCWIETSVWDTEGPSIGGF
jgi:hypothetical protein